MDTGFECLGCGVDTAEIHEYYMIHDHLWLRVNPADYGMLCISCLEERLGRRLRHYDFTDAPLNISNAWKRSDRLTDRLNTVPTPVVPIVYT